MADTSGKPKFQSLADRIAALNNQPNFATPSAPPMGVPVKRPPPLPPTSHKPAIPHNTSLSDKLDPPPPPRGNGHTKTKIAPSPCPALPPRRSSSQPVQPTGSGSSNTTNATHQNHTYLPKLPPSFGDSKLPPLPQKAGSAKQPRGQPRSHPPPLPPRLPARSVQLPPTHRPPPQSEPQTAPPLSNSWSRKDGPHDSPVITPPPVPINSRPSLRQIHQTRAAVEPNPHGCLVCRDFSAPDDVASQFPRQSLPQDNPVGYLARMICDPFPSLTDKARAVFTWCHHNIAYDWDSFVNKNVRNCTTSEIIFSGKAVCSGYSQVFSHVARTAGLECIEVSGHGKGLGHTTLALGSATPPQSCNHAWNAVRIDDGNWKLVDACWGAGHGGPDVPGGYEKKFAPENFTMANEKFAQKHFPSKKEHLFLPPEHTLTWEEYIWNSTRLARGAEPALFMATATEEGLDRCNFEPAAKRISRSEGPDHVRFQFAKMCPHWTAEVNGKGQPYLVFLHMPGRGTSDARDEFIYVESNHAWLWVDVLRKNLGPSGGKVGLVVITRLNGRDGRGLTRKEWDEKWIGGMSYSYLVLWEIEA